MNADIAMQGIVLALASGRVAYSLVHDEIMRPVREYVWLRSAPEGGTIRHQLGDGSFELRPAAMVHPVSFEGPQAVSCDARWLSQDYAFDPHMIPRDAGFFGQLFECPYCMSFWTSLLAAIAWLAFGEAAVVMAAPIALWALANIIAVKLL